MLLANFNRLVEGSQNFFCKGPGIFQALLAVHFCCSSCTLLLV